MTPTCASRVYIGGHHKWHLSQHRRLRNPYGHIRPSYLADRNSRNYFSVAGKEIRAARLLAFVFIDNQDPTHKIYVHHIDFNCSNDALPNLQWVSASEHTAIHKAAGQPPPGVDEDISSTDGSGSDTVESSLSV